MVYTVSLRAQYVPKTLWRRPSCRCFSSPRKLGIPRLRSVHIRAWMVAMVAPHEFVQDALLVELQISMFNKALE
jgi:hypothetical protein